MKFCTLASGSSGNCTVVFHGNTYILIDAGISLRRICASLKGLKITPDMLDAVFITHSHSDHIGALRTAAESFRVPVFAPEGECSAIAAAVPEAEPFLNAFPAGSTFQLGDLEIASFRTPHDTPESVGYCVRAGGRGFALATDLGYLTNTVVDAVSGADAAVLESNHDLRMLKTGPYPRYLKQRILGPGGHLSNDDCGVLAATLAESGTKRILLAHLSRENNTPEAAYTTVCASLKARDCLPDRDISVCVAPRCVMSPVFDV